MDILQHRYFDFHSNFKCLTANMSNPTKKRSLTAGL